MAESETTQQVTPPELRNPTGKGGFGDHPENRNPGGWRKEVSFSYQYKRFMAMTMAELEAFAAIPDEERIVVEDLAYKRVMAARKSLNDIKEITDRTEGKAPQPLDHTTKGEKLPEGGGHIIYLPQKLPDNYEEIMKLNEKPDVKENIAQ